jgi:hypothetical protein
VLHTRDSQCLLGSNWEHKNQRQNSNFQGAKLGKSPGFEALKTFGVRHVEQTLAPALPGWRSLQATSCLWASVSLFVEEDSNVWRVLVHKGTLCRTVLPGEELGCTHPRQRFRTPPWGWES